MLLYGSPQRKTGMCNIRMFLKLTFSVSDRWLIYSHCCRRCEAVEGADAADAVPGELLIGRLAFAFVALQEARHEEFLGERSQHNTTGPAVVDELVGIVKIHDPNDCTGLGSIIGDLVAVLGTDWFGACQPHERVAVGRRHVHTLE